MNQPTDPHLESPLPAAFPPDRLQEFLEGTQGAPARDLLVRALGGSPEADRRGDPHPRANRGAPLLRQGATALDIGCGPGKEVVLLLGLGYEVTAIDPYRSMIDATAEAIRGGGADWLKRSHLHVCTLEQIAADLPVRGFDVVHAGFVLPFVCPSAFPACFAALHRSLRDHGLLVAQFFGPDDQFVREAAPGAMTSHAASDLDGLLAPFELVHREEVRRDGRIGRGRPKFWHVHHVIARNR